MLALDNAIAASVVEPDVFVFDVLVLFVVEFDDAELLVLFDVFVEFDELALFVFDELAELDVLELVEFVVLSLVLFDDELLEDPAAMMIGKKLRAMRRHVTMITTIIPVVSFFDLCCCFVSGVVVSVVCVFVLV